MPQPSAEISVDARPLHVQDFALQRQDGLKAPISALLGATAGALALDDVDLALRRVLALAVRELAGQAGGVEHALAHHLARLARGLARLGRDHDLVHDLARHLRVLLQEAPQVLADGVLDDALDLAGDQLALGLRVEGRIGVLHVQHADQPLARVVTGQAVLDLFQ
jgi:hypothetical protein